MALAPPPPDSASHARWLQQLWDHVKGLTTTTGGGGSTSLDLGVETLLSRPTATNAEDDLFDASTLDAKWTAFNTPGSADLTSKPGWLTIPSNNLYGCGWLQPIPAGDITLETEVKLWDTNTSGHLAGILLTDGTGASGVSGTLFFFGGQFSATAKRFGIDKMLNNTWSTGLASYTHAAFDYRDRAFVRISRVGTAWKLYFSLDGWTWYDQSIGWTQTFTPTHCGVASGGTSMAYSWNHFVRR